MNGEHHPPKEIQIGGQAVIEGVVMRGPDNWAVAVRRPNGEIFVEESPAITLAQKYPRLNKFPLRGIFALVDSLVIGMKSLSISAGISLEEREGEGEGRADGDADGADGEAGDGKSGEAEKPISAFELTIALIISLGLFLGLFIVVPAVIAKSLDRFLASTVLYNLVEGLLRVTIFVLYLVMVSLLPDVKRLFEYHGAEHKVVHAYEAGVPLTPRSASVFSTSHMRCGTSFIVIVFVICILIYSLMGRPALWLRILERLAVIPLVAAFSYEIIKLAGKKESSPVVRTIMAPGLWLQRLTTREPDEDQVEVAIRALSAAVLEEPGAATAPPGIEAGSHV